MDTTQEKYLKLSAILTTIADEIERVAKDPTADRSQLIKLRNDAISLCGFSNAEVMQKELEECGASKMFPTLLLNSLEQPEDHQIISALTAYASTLPGVKWALNGEVCSENDEIATLSVKKVNGGHVISVETQSKSFGSHLVSAIIANGETRVGLFMNGRMTVALLSDEAFECVKKMG